MAEKKYQVVMPKVKNRYLAKSIESKYSEEFYNFLDHIPIMPDHWTERWRIGWQTEFTEKEIKEIDPNLWAFRKDV